MDNVLEKMGMSIPATGRQALEEIQRKMTELESCAQRIREELEHNKTEAFKTMNLHVLDSGDISTLQNSHQTIKNDAYRYCGGSSNLDVYSLNTLLTNMIQGYLIMSKVILKNHGRNVY